MFEDSLLESIKTETIMANVSHWLLKSDVHIKCFGSISDSRIKLALNTKSNILIKEQECCNNICVQNEMLVTIKLCVPRVILQNIFKCSLIIIIVIILYYCNLF